MPSPPTVSSDEAPPRKRPGVGFLRKPKIPQSLPSVPRLPPVTNPADPAFHPGYHASCVARRYPSLDELQDKSMRNHASLFASAQWFSSVSIRDLDDIRNTFSDAAGMLPGNLPMQALYTFDWRTRIAVPTSILRHSSPRGRSSLSLRFMEAVFARLEISTADSLILSCYHCDTWQSRTEDEQLYLENLIDCTFGDPVREADRL